MRTSSPSPPTGRSHGARAETPARAPPAIASSSAARRAGPALPAWPAEALSRRRPQHLLLADDRVDEALDLAVARQARLHTMTSRPSPGLIKEMRASAIGRSDAGTDTACPISAEFKMARRMPKAKQGELESRSGRETRGRSGLSVGGANVRRGLVNPWPGATSSPRIRRRGGRAASPRATRRRPALPRRGR